MTKFYKMHGCGNDYIYFDCIKGEEITNPSQLSIRLSDRHFGIGGDGIVLIYPSKVADAKMRMFNADGSEGKMCGNAIRCVGKFLYDKGYINKKQTDIETLSGIKHLELFGDSTIHSARVDMGSPKFKPEEIPINIDADSIINYSLSIWGLTYHITALSMGNPHCVLFCDDIQNIDIKSVSEQIVLSGIFSEGVNCEFVNVRGKNSLDMRVWERGSGETLACGTGACAAAVAATLNGYCQKDEDIKVKLKGGELTIKYTHDTVYMSGEAVMVFEGEINL